MNEFMASVLMILITVGMVSSANATTTTSPDNIEVNVISDTVTELTLTYYFDGPYPDTADFDISLAGVLTDELVGTWDNSDWTQIGAEPPHTTGQGIDPIDSNVKNMSTWQFYIQDGSDDSDDNDQIGREYIIDFYVDGVSSGNSVVTGKSTTIAYGIPEFPLIALPIATVLGLMFIISSRKKKE